MQSVPLKISTATLIEMWTLLLRQFLMDHYTVCTASKCFNSYFV